MRHEPKPAPLFANAEAARLFWLCAFLLLVASLALSFKALGFDFLYLRDDDVNVTVNPHMGGLTAARLGWMFTDWSYVRRYIPLGWLGFSATYEFAGLDPAAYHAVGLALYGANVVLVLCVLAQALRVLSPARAGGLTPWDAGAVAIAAAWWALNPMRVETTAWVSGNLYGQAGALLLASLLAYLRSYGAQGRRRAVLIALSCVLYASSLLTYPVALGVPVLLAGLDWLCSRADPRLSFRRLLLEKALFLVPLLGVLAVTVAARFAGAPTFGAVPGFHDLSLMSRLAQSCYVAVHYLWKPWWPTHLSPLYDTLMDFRASDPVFLASMAAVAALSVAALLGLRRRPAWGVAWFGYLACAAPFFGLTEKPHMASDRYAYFLTVIMAAVLAFILASAAARATRVLATAAALIVLACLAWMTSRQLEVWRSDRVQHRYVAGLLRNPELLDDFTSRLLILEFMRGNEAFAEDAVEAKLRSDPASQGYLKAEGIIADKRRVGAFYGGTSLLAILQEQTSLAFAKAGENREANDHLEAALRLDEKFYQAAYARAGVLLNLGRPADALSSYLRADRWASPPLPQAQRRAFLERLALVAGERGEPAMAARARAALAR